MKRILIVMILAVFAIPVAGQEQSLKRNNLSIAPLVFVNRTLNFSYSRHINDHWNFTIYPRYRIGNQERKTYDFITSAMDFDQPLFYSRVFIRSGLQYHRNWVLAEPLLQLDRGWFRDKWLEIDPNEGDGAYYQLQDRDYYSAGFILLTGFYHSYRLLRVRAYLGYGLHMKYFQIHSKEGENYSDWGPDFPYYETYYKLMHSIHLGVEIGVNF